MKKFLAILILILTFQTPSWADDIRDFQIEGMSIGDSLLDYFSEEEIKKNEVNYYNSETKNLCKVINKNKKMVVHMLNNILIYYQKIDLLT